MGTSLTRNKTQGDKVKTKSILLVEDNRAINILLKHILSNHGYTIKITESIQDAQKVIDTELSKFDLILLDLNLPGGTGFDILNNLPKDNKIPVIIVSALSQSHNVIRGLESGAADYITKPFNPQILMLRIEKLIRNPRCN